MLLHEFVTLYRDSIVIRAREKLTARPWPVPSPDELRHGVPLFLTQLSAVLQASPENSALANNAIASSAGRHGQDLLALGFSVSQVVHDYGDICQAITELAMEQNAPITTDEFRILNRCLDTAIAEAVSEHGRRSAVSRDAEELERSGQLAHETRDLLHTAILAYHALKRGTVAINGSTGAVLGRSLVSLRALVESGLTAARMASRAQKREPLLVSDLFDEVGTTAALHAELRGQFFSLEPVDRSWVLAADRSLLVSALSNLVSNGFKFSPLGGRVSVCARRSEAGRLEMDVADECGGLPDASGDPFQAFGDQRGRDRTGLGLGLSIARKAVRAHGGDIHVKNTPGIGCVFTIDLPFAPAAAAEPEMA